MSKEIEDRSEEIKEMKKRIKKYISLITKENLPTPSMGDCWHCCMRTEDEVTMGELSSDNHSHLYNHLDEGYLHGSILVNAMREYGYEDEQIGLHYSMKLYNTFKRAVRKYLQKRLINSIATR